MEDLELETSHVLTDAVQQAQAQFHLLKTASLQRTAAKRQVEVSLEEETRSPDFVLDAQRRAADADLAYHRSWAELQLANSEFHMRKGSLLRRHRIVLQ